MNTAQYNPLPRTLVLWLIVSALFFWFKGGYLPIVVAVSGLPTLWLLSRIAPGTLSVIAQLSPAKWTVLLVTGAVCAILGEIVITKVAPQMQVYGWLSRDTYEISPTRWFAHKPNLDVELTVPDYTYRLRTNSLGFRDREHAVQKPAGVVRVLLAGDSFTDGDGVRREENYPSVMERALNVATGADGADTAWEIINVSVPGYGPVESALTLAEFAPKYRPDLIIYGFYLGNDLADAMKSKSEKLRGIGLLKDDIPLFPFNNWLWHNSNFYVLLQNARGALKEKIRGGPTRRQLGLTGVRYFRKDAPATFEHGWQVTARALAQMKRIADSVGAGFLVALFPLRSQVTPHQLLKYYPPELDIGDTARYDVYWLQRSAHSKLDSLQITCLDLTADFRESKEQPLFNTLADHHPNRDGYRLTGERIAEVVREWKRGRKSQNE